MKLSADPVLDAVRRSVIAVGVRRTTLTEVARLAGVSRMTLYRRAPDLRALILELLTAELGGVLLTAETSAPERASGRERLVATAAAVVDQLPRNPVLRRVLELDPELLLPYLTERQGATQRHAVSEVRRLVDAGIADGSIRPCDSAVVAACLVQVLTPFVVGRGVLPRRAQAAAKAEVTRLLDSWLAP